MPSGVSHTGASGALAAAAGLPEASGSRGIEQNSGSKSFGAVIRSKFDVFGQQGTAKLGAGTTFVGARFLVGAGRHAFRAPAARRGLTRFAVQEVVPSAEKEIVNNREKDAAERGAYQIIALNARWGRRKG